MALGLVRVARIAANGDPGKHAKSVVALSGTPGRHESPSREGRFFYRMVVVAWIPLRCTQATTKARPPPRDA